MKKFSSVISVTAQVHIKPLRGVILIAKIISV